MKCIPFPFTLVSRSVLIALTVLILSFAARAEADSGTILAGQHDLGYVSEVQTFGRLFALEDGGLLIVSGSWLSRLDADGALLGEMVMVPTIQRPHVGFSVNHSILDAEGRLVIAGHVRGSDSAENQRVRRVDIETMAYDESFPELTGFNSNIMGLAELPQKGYLVTGQFSTIAGEEMPRLALIDYEGGVQSDFAADLDLTPFRIAVTPQGSIFISGQYGGNPYTYMAKVDADGQRDPDFPAFTSVVEFLYALRDGSCLVVHRNVETGYGLALLKPDGSIDEEFAPPGNFIGEGTYSGMIRDIAEQPDGKIVVVGEFFHVGETPAAGHVRLLRDGSIDPEYDASQGFRPTNILTPSAYPRSVAATDQHLFFTANASGVRFQGDTASGPGPVRVFATSQGLAPGPRWGGLPIVEGWVFGGEHYFGWLMVEHAPWLFSLSLDSYLYLPESYYTESATWAYFLDYGTVTPDGDPGWYWHHQLHTWAYIPGYAAGSGGWVYLLKSHF